MKFNLLMSAVFIIITLNSCSNSTNNDLKIDKLKGNVKSCKTVTYQPLMKFGEVVAGDIENIDYSKYDKNGNKIERYFETPGIYSSRQIYKYDENGRLVKESNYDVFENTFKSDTRYNYNNKNQKSEKLVYTDYENYKNPSRETYNYNDDGKLVESIFFSGNGILYSKSKMKYNSKGELIEKSSFNGKGELSGKIIYQYEDKSKVEKSDHYNAVGELIKRYVTKYNNKGQKIETYQFNKEGKQVYYSKVNYNEYGNESEVTTFYEDSGLITVNIEYEYDKQKNWTKQIAVNEENGTPTALIIRELEYYSNIETSKEGSLIITNESNNKKTFQTYPKESFKQLLIEGGLMDNNLFANKYEILLEDKLYKNYYFSVSIKFPESYTFDRGNAEHTVIRALDKDNAVSIILNIIPIAKDSTQIQLESEFQQSPLKCMEKLHPEGYENYLASKIRQSTNESMVDLETTELKINEIHYITYFYKSHPSFNNPPITYVSYSAETYLNGVEYYVGYSAPEFIADKEIFLDVLNSLRFNLKNAD